MDETKVLQLIKNAQAGCIQSKQDIILEFYHPVEQIAKSIRAGIDRMDLLGEGLIGVEHAIMTFDFRTPVFWNYARYHVRKHMFDFMLRWTEIVDKPRGYVQDHQWYLRCYTQYLNDTGREPTMNELKTMLGWGDKKFIRFMQSTQGADQYTLTTGNDLDGKTEDAMDYKTSVPFPMDQIEYESQLALLHNYIQNIGNSSEATVLMFRLQGRTLKYIGAKLGVSHERVRQVLDNSFKKLIRMYNVGDQH